MSNESLPEVDVVVRCKDEMPYTARTLAMLARQRGVHARVLFLDCGSKDGSREAAVESGARVVDIDPRAYIPGVVLNLGMRESSSSCVAFVNADAVPVDEWALSRLVEPLLVQSRVAATYARQVARPSAALDVRLDYERAFPAESRAEVKRGHFFSMAASAVRRSMWQALPFDELLRYSEDVDWARRVESLGFETAYVSVAAFEHSHDYDLAGQLRRRAGEGKADGAIFRLGPPSAIQDLLRPLAGAVLRDARARILSLRTLATRTVQAIGYYQGRRSN